MKTEILLEPRGVPAEWHSTLQETARFSRTIAVSRLLNEWAPAASAYLNRLANDTYRKECLFDPSGTVIAGTAARHFR